mgnify:CR=1 FL=1
MTPGMLGFLMTLLLAVAVIFLVRDFNRRNRRLRPPLGGVPDVV